MVDRRLDIDLLRAIAVLAVILFHFKVPGIEGGYIGVDIFFVISGYLISGQIVTRVRAGDFSYVVFFARRARRLVPALTATLLGTWLVGFFTLTTDIFHHTMKEMFFASAYLSNISYWLESGYFDTTAITKPLLHTWSLSVEEQFYIFWPLLILLVNRVGRQWLLPVIGLLSLVACEWMMRLDNSAAFFLFPFRIFEFAIGALIWEFRTPKKSTLTNIVSIVALSAVIAPSFILNERSQFPGVATLPACLGTAWIILARPGFVNHVNILTRVGKWLGRVSYSAYLVHWPLVVFYTSIYGEHIGLWGFSGLLLSTLVLSDLMWRFVEQTFLHSSIPVTKFIWSVPVSMVLGFGLMASGPSIYAKLNQARHDINTLVENLEPRGEIYHRLGVGPGETDPIWPRLTVVGDSHAVDLSIALRISATIPVTVNLTRTLCDPLTVQLTEQQLVSLYGDLNNPKITPDICREIHLKLLHQISDQHPNVVIFSERWREAALPYLAGTIQMIQKATKATVIVLGRNQEFQDDPGALLNRAKSVDQINNAAWLRRGKHDELNEAVKVIAKETGAIFIERNTIVCPRVGTCDYLIEDGLSYLDKSHWTEAGMRLFGSRLFKSIAAATELK